VKRSSLIPVILCGGTGTRLWPVSRSTYPKQYWNLTGKNKQTLLQQTQLRLEGLEEINDPIFICHEDHRFIVAEQIREINIKPNSIVLEPFGRNTAPAIAIAALKALEEDKDPILLVLSADHEINEVNTFHKTINAGRKFAEQGRLVTFGIIPSGPETGYGYIEAISSLENKQNPIGVDIARFVEKPDKETAKKFLNDKKFTWNSGIFLFKAQTILNELQRLEPNLLKACKCALNEGKNDLDFLRLDKKAFDKCANLAIDVAVMERTNLGTVLPLNAGWNDIGSWKALWETETKDKKGNVIKGNVISKSSSNCYLRSDSRLVVGIGLENIVVVETDDAVLISDIEETQEVKKIVKDLEKKGASQGKAHKKIYRPWGNFTSVVEGKRWQVKKIEVKPGASLSLQMHHHRAEHWIVVKGTALVERDNKKELLKVNQSTYIPLGCKHRLSNPGRLPVELIEVQSGDYLGEDDIIRFDDIYGRLNNK
tara:strand:+ start:438 stop:1886 length:1449 start_codon:yes stop_codon:yes gene_type:complete